MINVLHLRDSPWIDGPGRTILETGSTIDRESFRYIIGTFVGEGAGNDALYLEARRREIPAHAIRERRRLDPGVLSRILKIVDQEKVDIIHAHEVRSDLLGLICARARGLPAVTTLHGWIRNDARGHALVFLDKLFLLRFDHVVTVSSALAEEVMDFGLDSSRVTVVHNAIVPDRLKPDRADRRLRRDLDLADDEILIGKIGRLSPEKGLPGLLAAMREVRRAGYPARLAIAGIGPEEEATRTLVSELGLGNAVHFLGYQQDMQPVYNSLDLVVQASLTEGMPNVIIEALLMGLPVVATDVGGTREVLEGGKHGILVPPGRPEALAEAIVGFCRNPGETIERARNGRRFIREFFGFEARTRKMEALYRSLHRGRRS